MQYVDLQYFIDLDLPFYEPKNIRRGGWSGVSKVNWEGHVYFLKRQVNHTYRAPRRLFRLTPTLFREQRNIKRLQKIGIKTPRIVLYAEDHGAAMLITCELKNHVDLDVFMASETSAKARATVIESLLLQTILMHQHGYQHGCLYGKHIMVDQSDLANTAFIDLEKLKYSISKQSSASRDIDQLLRHSPSLNDQDREMILTAYEKAFPGTGTIIRQRMANKHSQHSDQQES